MNILFVHQNFPGQFKHLAPALAVDSGNRIMAFTMHNPPNMHGVRGVMYRPGRGSTRGIHPLLSDFESKLIRGEVAFKAARKVHAELDFSPDLIVAHHGWGESLFLKEVWPQARVLLYCEWYYPLTGADFEFDPEFRQNDPLAARSKLRVKNAHNLLALEQADAGVSPTHWQKQTHPVWFQPRIEVVHDGIDTRHLTPQRPASPLRLTIAADADCRIEPAELVLDADDEIITFVNRNLEPYRGYHVFMRALPALLRRCPKAKVVIVGGNATSYGAAPPKGSWKQIFLDEVRDDLDMSRVHFVGRIPYAAFVHLLQITTVHTYLTYPFVLSWSLLEAMACGGAIVASDTEPVREVITDGETGRLVNFFDGAALVERICELLDDRAQRERLGAAARALAVERYDLRQHCLPRQLSLVRRIAVGDY